jgi:hypothetical protein
MLSTSVSVFVLSVFPPQAVSNPAAIRGIKNFFIFKFFVCAKLVNAEHFSLPYQALFSSISSWIAKVDGLSILTFK